MKNILDLRFTYLASLNIYHSVLELRGPHYCSSCYEFLLLTFQNISIKVESHHFYILLHIYKYYVDHENLKY